MTHPASAATPAHTTLTVGKETITIKGRSANPDQTMRDVANYVADMILELRNMAKSAKLFKVMVPLEFAYYEAFNVAHHVEVPQAELDRLQHLSQVAKTYEGDCGTSEDGGTRGAAG
jgi:hypothetical protein